MTMYETLLSAGQLREDIQKDAELITHDRVVDYEGQPANRTRTGGWRIAPFICAIEVAEKVATVGSVSNLVPYLTIEKDLPLSYAVNMKTNYLGTAMFCPLLGGLLADSGIGHYYILIVSAITHMLGLFMMLFTAVIPWLANQDKDCTEPSNCRSVHGVGLAAIYAGLYLMALGTGGIKATVSTFGAAQFDDGDAKESELLANYFTWFYWATMLGSLISCTFIVYMQDNLGFGWGYGTLVVIMWLALVQLICKRRLYRYRLPSKNGPLLVVARVLVAAARNFSLLPLTEQEIAKHYEDMRIRKVERVPVHTRSMKCLDKAAKYNMASSDARSLWRNCDINEVEDVKMLLRLLPICLFTMYSWTVGSQTAAFGVAQIGTSQRHIRPNFEVPSASVAPLTMTFTALMFLPLYDRIMMPALKKLTGQPKGLTTLQRIGVGLALPTLGLIVAALVESRRLGVVRELHMEGEPEAILPFSVWWFLPQYIILGISEAFVYPGQLDFFYSEAPDSMQSLGTALAFCTMSLGFFSSSAIVSTVKSVTGNFQYGDWLTDNVNTSRLDKFYWLSSIIATMNFGFYLLVAKLHSYKQFDTTMIRNS